MDANINKFFYADSLYTTELIKKKYTSQIYQPQNLMVYNDTALILAKNSILELNGKLEINTGCLDYYYRSSILRMDQNSRFIVTHGNARISYGADITLFKNSILTVGDSFINSDCRIRCGSNITIGDDCVISHGVVILDSDFHILIDEGEEKPRYGHGVTIGNNVWIGSEVRILKNVTIGDGAVIAAGSIVTSDVPAHSLVAGQPARIVKKYIKWEK